MNTTKSAFGSFALAFAIAVLGAGPARAQSDQDHSVHNPDAAQAQSTQAMPAPGNGMSGMGIQGGKPGMMGGNMQQMMGMMQMMEHIGQMGREEMGGPMGMMRFDHIEGRIAFLRAELGITDAQQPQWDAFADALRKQASTMRTMRTQMMQGGMPTNWLDRLTRHERMLSARLDAMKAIEGPARALYGVLSPEQQSKADNLMGRPMGGM